MKPECKYNRLLKVLNKCEQELVEVSHNNCNDFVVRDNILVLLSYIAEIQAKTEQKIIGGK